MFMFLKSSFFTEQVEQWELPHPIPFPSHTLERLSAHQVPLLQECQCLWWAPACEALSQGLKLTHRDHKPPNKKKRKSISSHYKPCQNLRWCCLVFTVVMAYFPYESFCTASPPITHRVPHTLGQPRCTSGLSISSLMLHIILCGPQAPSSSPVFKS